MNCVVGMASQATIGRLNSEVSWSPALHPEPRVLGATATTVRVGTLARLVPPLDSGRKPVLSSRRLATKNAHWEEICTVLREGFDAVGDGFIAIVQSRSAAAEDTSKRLQRLENNCKTILSDQKTILRLLEGSKGLMKSIERDTEPQTALLQSLKGQQSAQ